jgi:hypothetical protein
LPGFLCCTGGCPYPGLSERSSAGGEDYRTALCPARKACRRDRGRRYGQPHLFRSRRQRGCAAPPPKEFGLHCALVDLLRRWTVPGWIWTQFPAGEERPWQVDAKGRRFSMAGARLARMGLQPGWPEFQFAHMNGRFCFLELKREKSGRLSEEQIDIATFLIAAGHGYLCTSSFDDAVATLKDWGVLRSGIHVQ